MKKILKHPSLLLIFSGMMLLGSCEKLDLRIEVPACIENKIEDISKQPVWDPPAKVYQWIVDGETYYYFTSDCCDQFNYLYDTECNVVCAPDGGFTGNGDGNCPDFKGPIHLELVWSDDR